MIFGWILRDKKVFGRLAALSFHTNLFLDSQNKDVDEIVGKSQARDVVF